MAKRTKLTWRGKERLTARYVAEIERRGGETTIEDKNKSTHLKLTDHDSVRGRALSLLQASGWRYYSCRFGSRRACISYLCGMDDNGAWTVRVPGTLETVREALGWVEPLEVHRARRQRRKVLRQGDVYAIEMRLDRAQDSADDLPDSHSWHHRARVLLHSDDERPHAPLVVPFRAKFVQQRAYLMGRGAGVGGAD